MNASESIGEFKNSKLVVFSPAIQTAHSPPLCHSTPPLNNSIELFSGHKFY